jgi:HNH endonuclease
MSRVPRTVWIEVIRKCDGNCWFCGREAKTVDHATPRSRGGTNHIDNLLPACVYCNNLKGDMSIRMFRKHVKFLIARKMLSNGMIWGGLFGLVIRFHGEGERNPLKY